MNMLVILKQTFDTEERITIENGQIINEENVQLIINPYDEYAVEEAVQLKEKHGGEVTVITIGSPEAESALRTALAMGADKAVLIENEDRPLDEYSIAKVLAAAIKDREYDVILGGNMSVDNGAAQVGPRVAEELGIPHISSITKLEIDGESVQVQRDVEGDVEIITSSLPILVTAQQGLNEPRYPSLPGIRKAKNKPFERLSIEDLGVSEDHLRPKSQVLDHYLPPKKEAGRILAGDLKAQVGELVQILCDEEKVVQRGRTA